LLLLPNGNFPLPFPKMLPKGSGKFLKRGERPLHHPNAAYWLHIRFGDEYDEESIWSI
jgi:hypothetical protein